MDGVIADLELHANSILDNDKFLKGMYQHHIDRIPGVFRNPPPIKGAIDAITQLHESGKYHMFIASAAPWGNPAASTDKRYYIEQLFGRMFRKRLTITHQKDLLIGDYLIDDRTANGAGDFGKLTGRGEHLHFGSKRFPNWESILEFLL